MVPVYTFYLFFVVLKADSGDRQESRQKKFLSKNSVVTYEDLLKKNQLLLSINMSCHELQDRRIQDWQQQDCPKKKAKTNAEIKLDGSISQLSKLNHKAKRNNLP